MQSVAHALIGDTFYLKNKPVEPFPDFKPLQPMVYAGIYPVDPSESVSLKSAIEKLLLTDSAVTVTGESRLIYKLSTYINFFQPSTAFNSLICYNLLKPKSLSTNLFNSSDYQ